MKSLKTMAAIVAVAALPAQAIAAEQSRCIERSAVSELATYMLPSLGKQALSGCNTHLPSNSILMTTGPKKMPAYEAASLSAKASAGATVTKFMDSKLLKGVDHDLALGMVEAFLVSGIGATLTQKDCQAINNIWGSLSALAPEKMGDLAASVVLAAMQDGKGSAKSKPGRSFKNLSICPFTLTAE